MLFAPVSNTLRWKQDRVLQSSKYQGYSYSCKLMTGKRKTILENFWCPTNDRTLGAHNGVTTISAQLRAQHPFTVHQCSNIVHPLLLLMHGDTIKYPPGAAAAVLPTTVSCAGGVKLNPIRIQLKIIKFSSAIRVEYSKSCNFNKDDS